MRKKCSYCRHKFIVQAPPPLCTGSLSALNLGIVLCFYAFCRYVIPLYCYFRLFTSNLGLPLLFQACCSKFRPYVHILGFPLLIQAFYYYTFRLSAPAVDFLLIFLAFCSCFRFSSSYCINILTKIFLFMEIGGKMSPFSL